MRYVIWAVLGVLVLMSLAAGGAKILQTEQEVQFFANAGIALRWMIALGVIQIIGACLAVMPRMRRAGLALMAVAFFASAAAIAMTGNTVFALISLIPAVLALLLAWKAKPAS